MFQENTIHAYILPNIIYILLGVIYKKLKILSLE